MPLEMFEALVVSVVADVARPLIFEVAIAAEALTSELVMSSDSLL